MYLSSNLIIGVTKMLQDYKVFGSYDNANNQLMIKLLASRKQCKNSENLATDLLKSLEKIWDINIIKNDEDFAINQLTDYFISSDYYWKHKTIVSHDTMGTWKKIVTSLTDWLKVYFTYQQSSLYEDYYILDIKFLLCLDTINSSEASKLDYSTLIKWIYDNFDAKELDKLYDENLDIAPDFLKKKSKLNGLDLYDILKILHNQGYYSEQISVTCRTTVYSLYNIDTDTEYLYYDDDFEKLNSWELSYIKKINYDPYQIFLENIPIWEIVKVDD